MSLVLAMLHLARFHIVHVVDELAVAAVMAGTPADGASMVAVEEAVRESGRKVLTSAQKLATRTIADVQADMIDSRGRTVAWVIVRYVKRVRGDLIVLGTHGRRGLSRLVMGSDAEAIVREATVPVLLVRATRRSRAARPRTPPSWIGKRSVVAGAAATPGM